jgi:hypothetical protein
MSPPRPRTAVKLTLRSCFDEPRVVREHHPAERLDAIHLPRLRCLADLPMLLTSTAGHP